jgi:hypothetical protein
LPVPPVRPLAGGSLEKKQACLKTDHAGNPEKPTSYDMPDAEIAAPGPIWKKYFSKNRSFFL